jgi:4'-phosphopantetheinyl transferase
MPLYKTINFSPTTQILVWKITESLGELRNEVALNASNTLRFNGMKSELHQRAFMSVRKLLQEKDYTDFDLEYDEFGKPHLKDGKHISISHSHDFAAIIISEQKVGIDIELQREKIIKIADKFVDYEFEFLDKKNLEEYIRKLTVIWGIKESIFKICNEIGISFKNHILAKSFEINDKSGSASLHFQNKTEDFSFHFEEIENFTLVFVFEKN